MMEYGWIALKMRITSIQQIETRSGSQDLAAAFLLDLVFCLSQHRGEHAREVGGQGISLSVWRTEGIYTEHRYRSGDREWAEKGEAAGEERQTHQLPPCVMRAPAHLLSSRP